MLERRRHPRREILTLGKVIFNNPLSVINCVVRDISEQGACIELPQPAQTPDIFELVINPNLKRRQCEVIWRLEKRIGVTFK